MAEEKETARDRRDSDKSSKESTLPYYKLFSFADSTDYLLMAVGTVAAAASGLSLPSLMFLFTDTLNAFGTYVKNNELDSIYKVVASYTFLGLASCVANFLQATCWSITGERQAQRIRKLYLKSVLRQDISYFDKGYNVGEVIEGISRDALLVQAAVGEQAGTFIQEMASFFGGFTLAFIRGWKLTLVMLSILPPLALSAAALYTLLTNIAARGSSTHSESTTIAEQTIGSIRTVVSFTGENHAADRYEKSLKKAYESSVLESLAAGASMGFTYFVLYSGYALCIWFGSLLILNEGYTGGDVLSVMFAVVVGSSSAGKASPCTSAFAAGQRAAFMLFEKINRKPDIDAYDTTGKVLDDIRGDIELQNVHFSYPTRPDEQILQGLSLLVPSGSTVALVGRSGSGKSTVISLILRFYDPQSGEVRIDGTNVKDFRLSWIRGKIGLVSQEPVLFTSSIRDNIAYGKDDATLEEIRAAVELANASGFIGKLPQGLDTMVGEHGTQLSGGQKQRVAMARAILKDPRILLLDEPTSALDVESERVMQEALDRVMVNRTSLIVAHRLTTVRNADVINVIHRGSVVESGSHCELLKDPNGSYAQLIHLQDENHRSDQPVLPDEHDIDRSSSRAGSLLTESYDGPNPEFFGRDNEVVSSKNTAIKQIGQDVPITRLAYLNKPELPIILLGTVAALACGVTFPLSGILLSDVVHTYYGPPSELKTNSSFWSLMYVAIGSATLVSFPVKAYFFSVAGSKLVRRVRLMTFTKVIHMEIGWFDRPENSSAAIGARLSADAAAVQSLVGGTFALVVQNAAALVAGLAIAFSASWQLAVTILAVAPVMAVNGWMHMKLMERLNSNAKVIHEEAIQVAADAVGSIRTVSSFTAEAKMLKLYENRSKGLMVTGIKKAFIKGFGLGISFFMFFGFHAVCFFVGAQLVHHGQTTFAQLFCAFFALSMAAVGIITQSSTVTSDATKAKSATASVFAVIDRKSLIDACDDSGTVLETVRGEVEFQHVSFRYPSRPDVQVLHDFSIALQSGKTLALVGESGCGKSTVISLLQRFYDPDSGSILLDGISIQKLKLRWLRQQMGLVSQEPVLFNDTIRANIAYAKGGNATEAEILSAAEAANAHLFISALLEGYDTLVGERGVKLSGGQKQRVAIARAIAKEPKILLLDEATSALDAESERAVQDALCQLSANRTTIIVAHQLATVRNADLIAVVKNGVVVEKGKHADLINIQDGVYASLAAAHVSISN